MRRTLFICAAVLLTATIAAAQGNSKLEAQLIQMDKDWTAAELRGDAKAVGMFIADDFWATSPEGQIQNRAQYMADLKPSKDTDVADEYAIRFYGKDVAVMTHRGTVKGERDLQYRSTHVWVNRGGRWQIVAHHSSEIAPAEPTKASEAKPADMPAGSRLDGAKPSAAALEADSAEAKPE